jgi:hypothetical protein
MKYNYNDDIHYFFFNTFSNTKCKICDENVECIPDEEDPPVVDPSVNPAGMRFVNNH